MVQQTGAPRPGVGDCGESRVSALRLAPELPPPPPLPKGPFNLIVADPPWRYSYSTRKSELDGTGWHGAQFKHYRTMTFAEIEALPIAQSASSNSLCALWIVNPLLPKCLRVLEAWGFDYRGMVTWVKTDKRTGTKPFFGNGYWVRGATEHLVFGVRGKVKPFSRREVSWFSARVQKHSQKPEAAFELFHRLIGEGPKLELFARVPRVGWTVWGNEVHQ